MYNMNVLPLVPLSVLCSAAPSSLEQHCHLVAGLSLPPDKLHCKVVLSTLIQLVALCDICTITELMRTTWGLAPWGGNALHALMWGMGKESRASLVWTARVPLLLLWFNTKLSIITRVVFTLSCTTNVCKVCFYFPTYLTPARLQPQDQCKRL